MKQQIIGLICALAGCAILGACGQSDEDGASGVTASEASALNDAATMLDARAHLPNSNDPGNSDAASSNNDSAR